MGKLLGAVFLGWALGANDAANVFGPAVSTRAVRYHVAVLIAATLVMMGAWLGGRRAMESVGALGAQTPHSAFLVTLSAAVGMTFLISFRLPASSSQAVVGAILGAALARGADVDVPILVHLVRGWLLTAPVAAAVSLLFYGLMAAALRWRQPRGLVALDRIIRTALIAAGAWGAYALGANNAANVTGVFAASGLVSKTHGALIAGGSIGLGILTFGHRMMYLVGRGLVRLQPGTALVAMLAQAVTVHAFAVLGTPVSTSQALAGGAIGIGLAKGVRTINGRALLNILLGWVATPLVGAVLSFVAVKVLGSH
ncbi:MAG: anion permease [Candidatus Krumholzibacteriia bacterium]